MKGKETFIFHIKWKETFDFLSDGEAGKLIKHILKYVTGENPQAPDRITELTFTPIKQDLIKDLIKNLNR